MLPKGLDREVFLKVFESIIEKLDETYVWNHSEIEKAFAQGMQIEGVSIKKPQVFMQTRLMCFGRADSPPLFETMEVLGREQTRARLRAGLQHVRTLA